MKSWIRKGWRQYPSVVTALKVDGAVFFLSAPRDFAPGLATSILIDHPTFLAELERIFEGMRKAGLPEE